MRAEQSLAEFSNKMKVTLELPKWFDLHAHFRQGPAMAGYLQAHINMGCAGVLAMPNTIPPVSQVFGPASKAGWSIEQYLQDLRASGGNALEALIVPLYLTQKTTPEMIIQGAESGLLKACKYYPPHATTNAEHSISIDRWIGGDVLRQMEETETILCLHGEQHGLSEEKYLDVETNAESIFYREQMPRLRDQHPRLRIVCEHITSKEAVAFVQLAGSRVGATITPQHLLYTIGHLIRGLRHPLYCLPVLKFEADRYALRAAVTSPKQSQFFAGTDSAPHTTKSTECGCAAGCFTGGYAPQLYAMAFEESGALLNTKSGRLQFERFLCVNGAAFYRLPLSKHRFYLEKCAQTCVPLETPEGPVIPLPLGINLPLTWRLATKPTSQN